MPPPPEGGRLIPRPHLAVGARTHESEFRGCAGPFQTTPRPLRHLLRKCHLPRRGRLIPRPHLAGTQTALPSVPVPTESEFRGCTSPFQRAPRPLRHLLRKCHLPHRGRLIPHPHLAGTQTALPSVPVPTMVSFVVVPAPSKGHRALSAICSANATSPEGGG